MEGRRGGGQKKEKAHQVQTVEPGHQEEKNNKKRKIKTLNAEQQKKQNLEKRQRETSRMGVNRYHLLVFSRGCLLF